MGGILGNLEPTSPSFPLARKHPLVKGERIWCPFSESRRVPDAVIDELAGNGIAYSASKGDARELVRTAIRNFDALHFQATLDERYPSAYRKALKRSKSALTSFQRLPDAPLNSCDACHRRTLWQQLWISALLTRRLRFSEGSLKN